MTRQRAFDVFIVGLSVLLGTFAETAYATTISVTINTTAVAGSSSKLVFDFVTNAPERGEHLELLNFSAPGAVIGLPETLGGLVSGDLILLRNPAPFTVVDADFFFNEIAVNIQRFTEAITVTLQIPDLAPVPGVPPDEFALFLLDSAGRPLPTSDPLGANALFVIDITGSAGGVSGAFVPAVFTSPNNVQITIPSPSITVQIQIKPVDDGTPSIIPKSRGAIPVAILSTPGFSTADLDAKTLTFGRTGNEQSLAFCNPPEDVNRDGRLDLMCHFDTSLTGFQTGDATGTLKGKTVTGTLITG